MGTIEIATLILGLFGKGAELAAQAIQASRDGDDARALALLDQALDHADGMPAIARTELAAVKERIAKKIADKFDVGGEPAHPVAVGAGAKVDE